MKVAVIGLGTMGMGSALNLVRKGHQVCGCDVREAARTELSAAGVAAVGSAAELPSDTEAVVVFVVTAAQTEDVLFGAQGSGEVGQKARYCAAPRSPRKPHARWMGRSARLGS